MLTSAIAPVEHGEDDRLPQRLAAAFEQKISQNELELPLLPDIAQRVIRMAGDESTGAAGLAETIKRDAAMAAHLLRVANSALYRGRSNIVSLQQAVSRLGMRPVREIALAIACQTRVFKAKGFEVELKSLFRHSLAAALFAQEIARLRRFNVEEAFLCGLLHDVGRPVVLQATVDLAEELETEASRAAILANADQRHAQVGYALVVRWELPVRVAEAVLHHHAPAESGQSRAQANLTLLADLLAHLCVGTSDVDEPAIRSHTALEELNIYPNELDGLLAMRERIREAAEAF